MCNTGSFNIFSYHPQGIMLIVPAAHPNAIEHSEHSYPHCLAKLSPVKFPSIPDLVFAVNDQDYLNIGILQDPLQTIGSSSFTTTRKNYYSHCLERSFRLLKHSLNSL